MTIHGQSGAASRAGYIRDLESEPRWDPALVRRVLLIRASSAVSLGVITATVPAFGPNRYLLSAFLILVAPAVMFIAFRVFDSDRLLVNATLIDMVWAVLVPHFVPPTYSGSLLVAVAMLAFVANEDPRALIRASAIGVIGYPIVGILHDPYFWLPLYAVFVMLLPLLIFMATTQNEREIRHQIRMRYGAEHDSLTGLRNRVGLASALEQAPAHALIAIDLDGFKDINDTLGHEAGDALLAALASRMNEEIDGRGVLARIGGDEFAVAVGDADPNLVASQVLSACRRRVALGDVDVSIGASIGIATSDGEADGHELLRRADLAMYEAKRSQGGVRRWSDSTRSASKQRVSLSGEVEAGFEKGQFELYYQPIVSMETGDVEDVEGLLRWNHPERGLLAPEDFLELVEGIGRRSSMDRLVFDQAAELAARLSPAIGVSVNVSAGSLLRSSVPVVLDAALRRHGIAPQRITVEVIEDEMVDEHSTARAVLNALGELGVGIAIDDFGTGHSSLARLRRLPVTSLKIDRSFIMAMETSDDDRAIVSAVSELGRALDLMTVAEGVETMAVRDHMVKHGVRVDRLQGFGIAGPMPAEQLFEWLHPSTTDSDRIGTHG